MIILSIAIVSVVLLALLVWLCLRPMTVSLTFDDGVRAHLDIAAPLLEKHGWRGAFNICTDFCSPNPSSLTSRKLKILGLSEHPDARLDWNDARKLILRGHEVYPHSCSHEKLGELYQQGKLDVLQHEVVDAARAYAEHLGAWPKFFCCPYLDWTPGVRDLIRTNQMEMFNNGRPGLGGTNKEVARILETRYWEGRRHVDLMFHGIFADEGGYNPFATPEEFQGVLDEISTMEKKGVIRVINYSMAHFGPSRCARFFDLIEWSRNKFRRVWFCLIYSKLRRPG